MIDHRARSESVANCLSVCLATLNFDTYRCSFVGTWGLSHAALVLCFGRGLFLLLYFYFSALISQCGRTRRARDSQLREVEFTDSGVSFSETAQNTFSSAPKGSQRGTRRKMSDGQMRTGSMMQRAWGQIVVGPPGAGKTTYCQGMKMFMEAIERDAIVVNLDPANKETPYKCTVNITDLITVEEVMETLDLGTLLLDKRRVVVVHPLCRVEMLWHCWMHSTDLGFFACVGPNGALMYCIEYLEANIDWLLDKLKPHMDRYMLFDCPGQIELFTHNPSLAKIIQHLTKTNLQLCCVHLTDSHHCSDVAKYISATLVSLMVMLKLELPHVNVLSKIDLLEKFGPLELGQVESQ